MKDKIVQIVIVVVMSIVLGVLMSPAFTHRESAGAVGHADCKASIE